MDAGVCELATDEMNDRPKQGQSRAGRKRKEESRAAEIRQRLLTWRVSPERVRPSLRELARQLGTSHQLLKFYLDGLDRWSWKTDLERYHATAKEKNVVLTPADDERYLAWRRRIEAEEARGRERAAKQVRALLKKWFPGEFAKLFPRTE
jgi:hypothetical protein